MRSYYFLYFADEETLVKSDDIPFHTNSKKMVGSRIYAAILQGYFFLMNYSASLYISVSFKNWILSFTACLFSVKQAVPSGMVLINWLSRNNDNNVKH